MSIPIIDINSGDTMSSMVDKINYNFTLLSLKGGGPQGIQGIQGIRGPIGLQGEIGLQGIQGSSIHGGQPSSGSPVGDIYIDNGVIQQVTAPGEFQVITDLNYAVQSPFGQTDLQTINPHTGLEGFQFVLGINVNSPGIQGIQGTSLMHMVEQNGYDYLHFNNNSNIRIGSVSKETTGNTDVLKLTGSDLLVGHDTDISNNSIEFNSSGITLKNRLTMPTGFSNANFIIGSDIDGKIDTAANNIWGYCANGNTNIILPVTQDTSLNAVGCSNSISGYNDKIDRIFLNGNSLLDFDENFSTEKFFNISTGTNKISVFAKEGITIGNTKDGTYHTTLEQSEFGLFVTQPENTTLAACPRISISSAFSQSTIISAETLSISSTIASIADTSANWRYSNLMQIVTGLDYSRALREKYSNLIVADKKQLGTDKLASDSLHIHGADENSSGVGGDIVISGGNTEGGTSFKNVGGDVYISGGLCERVTNSTIQNDMFRSGNVIIGVNPLHHKSLFSSSNYTSIDNVDRNAGTNPKDVNFFDVNNVAIHGNRIIIDSDANDRKCTNGYMNQNVSRMPYVTTPEKTTLQVSGVNTIKHEQPLILDQSDICAHQFMSGTMRRIIRFKSNDAFTNVTVASVNPDTMYSTNDVYYSYTNNDTNGSVYFMYDQVWQKVGNTVNVQLYGRWLASKPNDGRLYYICENMFFDISNPSNTNMSSKWIDNYNCKNRTLEYFLLNCGSSSISYKNIVSNQDDLNKQPLTVIALPISVKGTKARYTYGSGNIFTEYINSSVSNNSVLHSTPVMLGAYHGAKNSGSSIYIDTTQYGYSSTASSHNTGMRSYIHNSPNDRNDSAESPSLWAGNAYPDSTAINTNDERFSPTQTGTPTYFWEERNFAAHKTEETNAEWCYIYPEMLVDYGNANSNNNVYSNNTVLRPCVGTYTWINMNYSYNIMNGFNYEIPQFCYKGLNNIVSPLK